MLANKSTHVPLRWLGETERCRLAQSLSEMCSEVLAKWRMRSHTNSGLRWEYISRDGLGQPNSGVFSVVMGTETLLTWVLGTEALGQLAVVPVGAFGAVRQEDGLVQAIEFDFIHALSEAVVPTAWRGRWQLRRDAVSASICERTPQHWLQLINGSQAMNCQMRASPKVLDLLLPRARLKASTSLTARRGAIAKELVSLSAHLGQIEMSLKDLRTLVSGDVVVLQAPLVKPVIISTDRGKFLAEGTLGSQEGNRAVRLVSIGSDTQSKLRSSDLRSSQ